MSFFPAVLSMGSTTIHAAAPTVDEYDLKISGDDLTTSTFSDDSIKPESAVRILPCNHTFGRACLEAWFTISKSNRCPECNHELFPNCHIRLFLRHPTRTMRLEFAMYIEKICSDSETAQEIRQRLMSDWTRSLIREFAMELWRQQGYDVEYQYVSGAAVEEEENGKENEETDETDIDESDIDDSEDTECGALRRLDILFGAVAQCLDFVWIL